MIRCILFREIKRDNTTLQQLMLPKAYKQTVLQGLHNDVYAIWPRS